MRDFEPSKEVLVFNLNVVLILKIAIDITDYIPEVQQVFVLLLGPLCPKMSNLAFFFFLLFEVFVAL